MKYSIDNFRVEQKADYKKLMMEITTDSSIHPKDALKEMQDSDASFHVVL